MISSSKYLLLPFHLYIYRMTEFYSIEFISIFAIFLIILRNVDFLSKETDDFRVIVVVQHIETRNAYLLNVTRSLTATISV